MKICQTEICVDDYLLDRLNEAGREEFEDHYFNCPACFETVSERAEMIAVIKEQGKSVFKEQLTTQPAKSGLMARALALLSPRQWAAAAVSTVLIVVAVIGIMPRPNNTTSLEFFVNDDVVRGDSVTLISPVINSSDVPKEFRWESSGEGVGYRISLYSHLQMQGEGQGYVHEPELLWSGDTAETSIFLPDEVASKMAAGGKYSWQVRAFSAEGSLIAVSSRAQFQITR
jgi:hypothetical protein